MAGDFDRNIIIDVQAQLTKSSKYVSISSVLIVIIAVVVIYCLFQIIDITTRWMKYNDINTQSKQKATAGNILTDRTNDDETYQTESTDLSNADDDYDKITKTIQESLDQYKTYNEKITEIYKKKKAEPQDLVDKKIFDANQDNY